MKKTSAGKVAPLLQAIQAQPMREFTSAEAAQIMGIDPRAVCAAIGTARYNGLVFCRVVRKKLRIRGVPYEAAPEPAPAWSPDHDVRVPRVVPGWRPPAMIAPRG